MEINIEKFIINDNYYLADDETHKELPGYRFTVTRECGLGDKYFHFCIDAVYIEEYEYDDDDNLIITEVAKINLDN